MLQRRQVDWGSSLDAGMEALCHGKQGTQYMMMHIRIAREMVICHNPHNLLDLDYHIITQLGYKPT